MPDPLVLVEVLSPRTRAGDLTRKLVEVPMAGDLRLDPPGLMITVEEVYGS